MSVNVLSIAMKFGFKDGDSKTGRSAFAVSSTLRTKWTPLA